MTERLSAPTNNHNRDSDDISRNGESMRADRLRIVIAGLDQNVRPQAIEAANDRLLVELGPDSGGFKGFLNKIWKKGLRGYYLKKYTGQAEKHIQETGNILAHHGVDADKYKAATTQRFGHELGDMMLHAETGETRHVFSHDGDDAIRSEMKEGLYGLIDNYASGRLESDDDFEEAKKRMLNELAEKGVSQEYIGEGLLVADNLLQVAQNVKTMVDHNEGTARELLDEADIVVGQARVGSHMETQQNRFERMTDKLAAKPWMNETVVAAAASAVTFAGYAATKSTATAVGGMLAGGAVTGGVAALRVNKELREERKHTIRQASIGEIDAATAEQSDLGIYEMVAAKDLVAHLNELFDDEGNLNITDKASYEQAMAALADTKARISLSDEKKTYLIRVSSIEAESDERFELDLALAKTECAMRQFLENSTDEQLRNIFDIRGVDIAMMREGREDLLPKLLGDSKSAAVGALDVWKRLDQDTLQKDRIFNKTRQQEVSRAFINGTVLGVGMAGASSVASAAIHGNVGQLFASSTPAIEVGNSSVGVEVMQLNDYTEITWPEGVQVENNGDTLRVLTPDASIDVEVTPDGELTEQAKNVLESAGLTVDVDANDVIVESQEQTVTMTADDFVEKYSGDLQQVSREFWYDAGDTELGLSPPHIDDNGNVIFDISGMGSHAVSTTGAEMDWHTAAEDGNLKVALSLTEGVQSRVEMIEIDPEGHAILSHDSPIAQAIAEGDTPALTEVVEVGDVNEDGALNIRPLATAVGEGISSLQVTQETPVVHEVTKIHIGFAEVASAVETSPPVIAPPVIPYNPLSTRQRTEVRGDRSSETPTGPERLSPISDAEAARQLEIMARSQLFESRYSTYPNGYLEYIGAANGKRYFIRTNENGERIPGKAFWLTEDEALRGFRKGKLNTHEAVRPQPRQELGATQQPGPNSEPEPESSTPENEEAQQLKRIMAEGGLFEVQDLPIDSVEEPNDQGGMNVQSGGQRSGRFRLIGQELRGGQVMYVFEPINFYSKKTSDEKYYISERTVREARNQRTLRRYS